MIGHIWPLADLFRSLDQSRKLRLGVVRRDSTTSMPEQVLTIPERHTRRREPATESAFQIVNANVSRAL
jgi:hypothetical protein